MDLKFASLFQNNRFGTSIFPSKSLKKSHEKIKDITAQRSYLFCKSWLINIKILSIQMQVKRLNFSIQMPLYYNNILLYRYIIVYYNYNII